MMSGPIAPSQTTSYLVPLDTQVETSGSSQPFDLGSRQGKPVLLVLRISDIIEQESLEVSVWGSAEGENWGAKPLFRFPQKFYCGLTPAALDLSQRPETRFLQARWEVTRWGRGYPRPYFCFSLEVQNLEAGR